jgi:hypothetical protein
MWEEFRPDSFGRGWSAFFTLRDLRSADKIDVYADNHFLPAGMGAGAVVVGRCALKPVDLHVEGAWFQLFVTML